MKKSISIIGTVLFCCLVLSNCNKKQDEPLESKVTIEQSNSDFKFEQKNQKISL